MEPPERCVVRRAGVLDLKAVHALHRRAFPPGVAFSRDVLEGLLRHSRSTCFMAEDARGPVGFAGAVEGAPQAARLWTLHVAARARGRGVGDVLMRRLDEVWRARGVRQVELEVWRGNAAAIALYEKHGFEVTGRNDDAFSALRPPGAFEMARRFSAGSGPR